MSVGKRGSYYWMHFMFKGIRVQKTTRCKNKQDAEEVERAYRTQLAKGEVGIEPKRRIPRFAEAVKDFLVFCEIEHRNKPKTISSYMGSSKTLLEFFGDKCLDMIDARCVENYKIWRSQQPSKNQKRNRGKHFTTVANATVNRDLACLRLILNHQIKSGILNTNPVSRVKFLKENLDRWKVVSFSEEKLYLMAASQPLKDIATLILETGCRPGELFKLRIDEVNLDNGYLFVSSGKTRTARRRIPLSKRAFRVLDPRVSSSNRNFVFVNETTNKPITTVKKAHHGAISRSNVPSFRLYDLRHTFASRFVESGGDLITLKDLLGHVSLEMVLRYAHPAEEHRFKAIKRMEIAREKLIDLNLTTTYKQRSRIL